MAGASGIPLNPECDEFFKRIKASKDVKKKAGDDSLARYMVLKIKDCKEIVIDYDRMETAGDCDAEEPEHYTKVIKTLPENDARFLIYDYPYVASHGKSAKLILIFWTPEGVPVKARMVYAASKDAVKRAFSFGDSAGDIHADCLDDITPSEISTKLCKS